MNPLCYLFTQDYVNRKPPPHRAGQWAPVSGYKIKIQPISHNDRESMKPILTLVPAYPTSTVVDVPAEETPYHVQIAAFNIHGAGEYSPVSNVLLTTPGILYDLGSNGKGVNDHPANRSSTKTTL